MRFCRAADGEYRWFLVRAVPLRDDQGTILKWYGVVTDIEDRRLAEQAAGHSQATLRQQASLLDLTHDTIFVRDTNDVITYWNRGAEELYGWRREEAVGQVTHQLLRTIFPMPLAEIAAMLLRTGRWEGELVHARRDGTPVTVASRWSLQRDEAGRPAGTLETNNDITDRKRAEEHERLRSCRTIQRQPRHHDGRADRVAGARGEPANAAARTDANTRLRWLNRDQPDLEEAREAAKRTVMDASRAAEIISRIRSLFKKSAPEHELVDVNGWSLSRGADAQRSDASSHLGPHQPG